MEAVLSLEQRYGQVMERVAVSAERSGRRAEDILTVAVGKYADMQDIRSLIAMGHRDFGESRVQQLIQRAALLGEQTDRQRRMPATTKLSGAPSLTGMGVRWHMVGRLQRNKAKKLIGVTRLVHSVDSLKVAEELQNAAIRVDTELDVLIQVNATAEDQKGGCAIPAAPHLAAQVDDMFPLRPRGFMCMGPASRDEGETRLAFQRCADLFDETRKTGLAEGRFDILSMGMSGDFELAIECGANIVRVGSAIFGERDDLPETDGEDSEDA